jgi:hypothetical protein
VEIVHNGADHILEVVADETTLPRLGLVPGEYLLMFGSVKPTRTTRWCSMRSIWLLWPIALGRAGRRAAW